MMYIPLPAISISMLVAAPDIAEPSAKNTMNPRRIGFRPSVAARPPTSGRIAVEAIV
jgi:hypothetical protein